MKAILIGFEIQHLENITQMSAFIGNWQGNAAVIVKMPNPAKSYTLERATQINNNMDFQLGSCSERARTL